MKIKPLILLLISALTVNSSIAQTDEQTDTATGIDSAYNYFDENLDQTNANEKEKKPEKKPYVRIVMPFDTLSEMITYTGVIEQTDSYVDSLYERAKNWIALKWGGGVIKKGRQTMDKKFAEDVLYDKFRISLVVPLMVKVNQYNMQRNGDLQFTLEMRFKDGKYKYKFTNLVHILPVANNRKEPEYVYCEYYKGTEKNVVFSDRVLRGADAQINKMVEEIKKALKERIEIDEDEW